MACKILECSFNSVSLFVASYLFTSWRWRLKAVTPLLWHHLMAGWLRPLWGGGAWAWRLDKIRTFINTASFTVLFKWLSKVPKFESITRKNYILRLWCFDYIYSLCWSLWKKRQLNKNRIKNIPKCDWQL